MIPESSPENTTELTTPRTNYISFESLKTPLFLDTTFTHNEWLFNTSFHPRFYSRNRDFILLKMAERKNIHNIPVAGLLIAVFHNNHGILITSDAELAPSRVQEIFEDFETLGNLHDFKKAYNYALSLLHEKQEFFPLSAQTGIEVEYPPVSEIDGLSLYPGLSIQQQLTLVVMRSLFTRSISDYLCEEFGNVQRKDLFIIDPVTSERSYIDASIVPLVLSASQERKLRNSVSAIMKAKVALIESSHENDDLKAFLFDGVPQICTEIVSNSLATLPDHIRGRIDTMTNPERGNVNVLETNANEPQGDTSLSTISRAIHAHLRRYLSHIGANEEEISECFEGLELPACQVAKKIVTVLKEKKSQYPTMPDEFNIGILAMKDPVTRKPIGKVSNVEADNIVPYFESIEGIKKALSFDVFDICGFLSLDDKSHIPIVKCRSEEKEEKFPLHFIRRMQGALFSNSRVWEVLKKERPEIYYNFIGKQDETYNPNGKRIPAWMWMNPLNPFLTDKKLDAILSDIRLRERFNVERALSTYLAKRKEADSQEPQSPDTLLEASKIIKECERSIAGTRMLSVYETKADDGSFQRGLYNGDSNSLGVISDAELEEIKRNRRKYVVKTNTLFGHSGSGVYIGKGLALDEIPAKVIKSLEDNELERIKKLLEIELYRTGLSTMLSEENQRNFKNFLLSDPESVFEHSDLTDELLNFRAKRKRSLNTTFAFVVKTFVRDTRVINELQDILWPLLVNYARSHTSAIVQQLVPQQSARLVRIGLSGNEDKDEVTLHEPAEYFLDINPQTLGSEVSFFHGRGSLNQKSNITGGYGFRVLIFPEENAKRIVALVEKYRDV